MIRVLVPWTRRSSLCDILSIAQSTSVIKRFYPAHVKKLNREVRKSVMAGEAEQNAGKKKPDKKVKEKKEKGDEEAGPALTEINPPPEYLGFRVDLWQKLIQNQTEELGKKVPEPIQVTLPDGKVVAGESWRTTPYEVRFLNRWSPMSNIRGGFAIQLLIAWSY